MHCNHGHSQEAQMVTKRPLTLFIKASGCHSRYQTWAKHFACTNGNKTLLNIKLS